MTRRLSLAGVVLGALLLPLAGPVVASDPAMCSAQYSAFVAHPSISTARAVGTCEIDRRLDDLGIVRGKVVTARTLSASDRSTMLSRIDSSTSGLTSLRARVTSDSTLSALRADLHSIVWDYRVYVLVIRQDWLTDAADSELAGSATLEAFDRRLASWIEAAKAAGYDTTAVEADEATLQAAIHDVESSVTGLPGTLLALTVAGYNAGTAGPTMDAAAQTLATGWQRLVDAKAAAQKAVQDIQALR